MQHGGVCLKERRMNTVEESGASQRDTRVDLLRGAALLMIFVDHVPGNVLGDFTLRNFGFSDAAELFVLVAGFSAMAAYGRVFARRGYQAGFIKVFNRCIKLYGVQVALMLVTLVVVLAWTSSAGYEAIIVGPMLKDGLHGAMRGVMLSALPAYLDILPLYLILIAAFPLVYVGLSRMPRITLLASLAIYLAANLTRFNLTNRVDLAKTTEWMFDPFAWQFIFVIGAAMALVSAKHGGLPRSRGLSRACRFYLLFALIAAAPGHLWSNNWLDELRPLSFFNDPKVYLSPLRLLDALAMVYLALTSKRLERWSQAWIFTPLLRCGRHSLEIFATGTVLALFGRLAFRTWGEGVTMQIMINVTGFGILLALSYLLEKKPSQLGRFGTKADAPLIEDRMRRTV